MVGVAYRADSVLAVPDKRRDLGMGASAHRETSHIRPTQIVKNGPQNPGLLSSPSPRRAEAIRGPRGLVRSRQDGDRFFGRPIEGSPQRGGQRDHLLICLALANLDLCAVIGRPRETEQVAASGICKARWSSAPPSKRSPICAASPRTRRRCLPSFSISPSLTFDSTVCAALG